jgi:tetratricopeptide (TPR) repeat protein
VESLNKPASLTYGLPEGTQKGTGPIAAAKAFLNQAAELVEKNPQQAKSLLLRAIELDPKNAQAHFQLGLTFMALKNSPQAIEAYQKSIQLDPKFPGAYFNLGYIYAMDKNYSKAEENYAQVVKMAPSYLDQALFNLALAQEKQGKRKKSIENLERALQFNPKNEMAQKFLNKLKVSPG